MSRGGRKPLGPSLVDHLDGSDRAKERLHVILETITGRLTIADAAEQLGISEPMFYRLRTEVLSAGLARLEPRPMGRPRRTNSAQQEQFAAMAAHIAELEKQLVVSSVKEEIAQILSPDSRSPGDTGEKKTRSAKMQSRLHSQRTVRARRRTKPR